jgi:hypothetical protein
MTANRTHLTELLDEYLRILNNDLRVPLDLKLIQRGSLEFMPAESLSNVIPCIFVDIDPNIRINRVTMPDGLEVIYNFRFIYVKKLIEGENSLKVKETDFKLITEKILDEYRLTNLTLTNGQVLWSLVNEIEFKPPEDVYVASISADMIAMAFRVDTVVRSRR